MRKAGSARGTKGAGMAEGGRGAVALVSARFSSWLRGPFWSRIEKLMSGRQAGKRFERRVY